MPAVGIAEFFLNCYLSRRNGAVRWVPCDYPFESGRTRIGWMHGTAPYVLDQFNMGRKIWVKWQDAPG